MPTKLVRSLAGMTDALKNGVVTIGNFDGVHLGHQQLICRITDIAHKLKCPAIVITFEPHPYEFFAGEHLTIPRLTRLREKFDAVQALGVDALVILPFNHKLAKLSASEFISMIHAHLSPQHIVIGDDFHFGYKRQGNLALLKQMASQYHYTVEALPTVLVAGERVSSTRIRHALQAGDHTLANTLLGHPYTMQGRVRRGMQLGRQLDCPTANIFLHRLLTPVHGIYTVKMHGIGDKPLLGVANVGTRPTVDGTRTLLEVHLLDFDQDIYGRYVEVEFCTKLRPEERYANLDLLKAQMAKDVIAARDYFNMQNKIDGA